MDLLVHHELIAKQAGNKPGRKPITLYKFTKFRCKLSFTNLSSYQKMTFELFLDIYQLFTKDNFRLLHLLKQITIFFFNNNDYK